MEQFKDKKGRLDFDYIQTYLRKKAYIAKQKKIDADKKLYELQITKIILADSIIKKSGF